MGERRQSQSKHIGFKPKGTDPAHDLVYSVLDSLPRGGASDFIVRAVTEYLENHAGETISGSGKRKYIILGDRSDASETALKDLPGRPEPETPQKMVAPSPSDAVPSTEISTPEPIPSYTDLDDDTLESLVFGFLSDN